MRTKIDDMLERISPPMSRDRFDGLISTLCRNKMILMKPSGDATVWTVLDMPPFKARRLLDGEHFFISHAIRRKAAAP